MMAGMSLGKNALQRPSLKLDSLFVVDHQNAICRNRYGFAIHLATARFSVDRFGPGYEFCWVDHVSSTAWVNHCLCIRQVLHQ